MNFKFDDAKFDRIARMFAQRAVDLSNDRNTNTGMLDYGQRQAIADLKQYIEAEVNAASYTAPYRWIEAERMPAIVNGAIVEASKPRKDPIEPPIEPDVAPRAGRSAEFRKLEHDERGWEPK